MVLLALVVMLRSGALLHSLQAAGGAYSARVPLLWELAGYCLCAVAHGLNLVALH